MADRNEPTVSDPIFAMVAMGLLSANVVKIDVADPASLERLREATQKTCDALFPKRDVGTRVGFAHIPSV